MRGMILGLAVGLAVLLTAGEGRADYLNGERLNSVCNDPDRDPFSVAKCILYILGVYDAGEVLDRATHKRQWDGGWTACVSESSVSMLQLQEVVKKWLRENPAEWRYRASSVVAAALQEAFPCR